MGLSLKKTEIVFFRCILSASDGLKNIKKQDFYFTSEMVKGWDHFRSILVSIRLPHTPTFLGFSLRFAILPYEACYQLFQRKRIVLVPVHVIIVTENFYTKWWKLTQPGIHIHSSNPHVFPHSHNLPFLGPMCPVHSTLSILPNAFALLFLLSALIDKTLHTAESFTDDVSPFLGRTYPTLTHQTGPSAH